MIKPLNLNIDHWSMLDLADSSEPPTFDQDIIAILKDISNTNIYDDLWAFDEHEYVK